MLYPEICLPGLLPSYRTILSLVGALLCFLNEKVCQRLLAPRLPSFLAVFLPNQLCFLRSLSHFPVTVWDTSNQPLLGWLFYVHTDFFSLSFLLLNTFLFVQSFKKRKRASKNLHIRNGTYCCGDYQQNLKLHLFSEQPVIWDHAGRTLTHTRQSAVQKQLGEGRPECCVWTEDAGFMVPSFGTLLWCHVWLLEGPSLKSGGNRAGWMVESVENLSPPRALCAARETSPLGVPEGSGLICLVGRVHQAITR